jgi:hypothetical protein
MGVRFQEIARMNRAESVRQAHFVDHANLVVVLIDKPAEIQVELFDELRAYPAARLTNLRKQFGFPNVRGAVLFPK